MSDNAESPTENQKDEPSIQQTATEHIGLSDEKKKSMSYIHDLRNCYKLIAKGCCSVYFSRSSAIYFRDFAKIDSSASQ